MPDPALPADGIAARALDAHVAWILDRAADGPALDAWLVDTVDTLLAHAETLTLAEAVSCEQITETALRYAADLPLTGGIPELIGAVARALRDQPALADARIGDLVPDDAMRTFIAKTSELHGLRAAAAAELHRSDAVRGLVATLCLHALRGWIGEAAARTGRLGALGQRLPATVRDAFDLILARAAEQAGDGAAGLPEHLLRHIDEHALQDALEAFWDRIAEVPIAPLRDGLSDDDIEDFAALAYGYWQSLRDHPTYRAMIARGVGAVFERYGDTPLRALLADLGIDRAMMLHEARHYAPSVLAVLHERGILEAIVRAQLAPFYASDAFAGAVGTDGATTR